MGTRFTPAGLLVLGAAGAAAVVGLDTNRTVAYQLFCLLVVLLGLAVVASLGFRGEFTVERRLPRFGTMGEPLRYALVVSHRGSRPETGLSAREALADPRPTLPAFLAAREPDEARRNRFDRAVGYPRWIWLVRRNVRAGANEHPVPPLPPGGAAEVAAELVPRRRGYLDLAAVILSRPDAFGLFKAQRRVPAPCRVLVLPRRYPVPPLALPGARRFQPGGVSLAGSVGDSEEFVSLRDYRPGDPLRRIHWRSWARAGRPIVKEHQDEFFVRHALVLDTFASPERLDRLEEAVSVAASFAVAVPTQESLLDLMFVGDQAYTFTAGRGVGHVDRMLEVLACVEACHDKPFATLARAVAMRDAALSGCIVVLVDWDEPRRALLRQLAGRGMPVLALMIAGPADGPPDPADLAGLRDVTIHSLRMGRIADSLASLDAA
jgi:uncharacterized protein (DUF58 family)